MTKNAKSPIPALAKDCASADEKTEHACRAARLADLDLLTR